jgi:Secretion system C-terminal sorting domain
VAVLNGSKGFELNALLPSLVTSTAALNISSAIKDRLTISITDLNGRQFFVRQQELQPGSNQIQLNLLSLPAGQYFIKAVNGNSESRQLRFLKQ